MFSDDKMIIMPAVDIKDGNCVQLVQGKPGSEQVIIKNPEKVAKHWEDKGANVIHLIDLDGALYNKNSFNVIEKIRSTVSVPIQMGGGIRSLEYAKKLLDLGIDRIILGTMAIENPEIVETLSEEYSKDSIMISLDSKDSKVVIKGWTENISKSPAEVANEFENRGAGSILFTNVDVEGLLNGINIKPINNLLNHVNIPVVYAGGVSSIADLSLLRDETSINGVVIGSALYKNTINFSEALEYEKRI